MRKPSYKARAPRRLRSAAHFFHINLKFGPGAVTRAVTVLARNEIATRLGDAATRPAHNCHNTHA
jgi:hypothetical protein